MKTKRRTEITIETRRVLLIRRPRGSERAWCPECAADLRMITPEEAAILTKVSSRTIFRWVEADRLHFSETPGGLLLICLESLLQATAIEIDSRDDLAYANRGLAGSTGALD